MAFPMDREPPVQPIALTAIRAASLDGTSGISTPSAFDPAIPSPARMYDYYLGGKDNFPADREAAERALSVVPQGRTVARANRRFMVRAVRYAARNGVKQFIDLGTGIPTSPSVHEVARAIEPGTKVVYVDNDPAVTAHNRAFLSGQDKSVVAFHGDIRYPLGIAGSSALRRIIDFKEPVAVLFVAVLHFLTNGDDPYNSVFAFRDHLCKGSYVVVSHITSDGTDPNVIATIREAYANASAPAVFRSQEEIRQFFAGTELVKPGLVEVGDWRGNNHQRTNPPVLRFLGGVGRKLR